MHQVLVQPERLAEDSSERRRHNKLYSCRTKTLPMPGPTECGGADLTQKK
jgi:hypothetical protein